MGKDHELLEAARSGNITVVEKILYQKCKRTGPLASLRRGPGANVQDSSGYSALHHASLNGNTEVVRVLLANDATPNLPDARGSSPLHLAAWAGHQDIVKLLLTHSHRPANPNLQTVDNETPLHCAAQHGHTGALTTLLAHGADPKLINNRMETPLDLAAQYGRLEVVQMLIRAHPELLIAFKNNDDIDDDYHSNHQHHHHHQQQQHRSTTTSKQSSTTQTIHHHTPLHLASRNGHKTIVEILLAAGVNVNCLTNAGTALHEASLCGKHGVCKILLNNGANLEATDSKGRTALDLLRQFPPNVTHGIITVLTNHRNSTSYETDDADSDFRDTTASSSFNNLHNLNNNNNQKQNQNHHLNYHQNFHSNYHQNQQQQQSKHRNISPSSSSQHSQHCNWNYSHHDTMTSPSSSMGSLGPSPSSPSSSSLHRSRSGIAAASAAIGGNGAFAVVSAATAAASSGSDSYYVPMGPIIQQQQSAMGSSKVSPTPPKKPPRRNLSVSPTHQQQHQQQYQFQHHHSSPYQQSNNGGNGSNLSLMSTSMDSATIYQQQQQQLQRGGFITGNPNSNSSSAPYEYLFLARSGGVGTGIGGTGINSKYDTDELHRYKDKSLKKIQRVASVDQYVQMNPFGAIITTTTIASSMGALNLKNTMTTVTAGANGGTTTQHHHLQHNQNTISNLSSCGIQASSTLKSTTTSSMPIALSTIGSQSTTPTTAATTTTTTTTTTTNITVNPPLPLPRNFLLTSNYENTTLKSYNPNRKLRRNRDNYEEFLMDSTMKKNEDDPNGVVKQVGDGSGDKNNKNLGTKASSEKIPSSPTNYKQPPTPEHPPPSASHAEKCIHERIRPLSQEYKRLSAASLKDNNYGTVPITHHHHHHQHHRNRNHDKSQNDKNNFNNKNIIAQNVQGGFGSNRMGFGGGGGGGGGGGCMIGNNGNNNDYGLSPSDHHVPSSSLGASSGSLSSSVSFSDRSASTDCVEEFIGDVPFAGLFRGSTITLNNNNNQQNQLDYYQRLSTFHQPNNFNLNLNLNEAQQQQQQHYYYQPQQQQQASIKSRINTSLSSSVADQRAKSFRGIPVAAPLPPATTIQTSTTTTITTTQTTTAITTTNNKNRNDGQNLKYYDDELSRRNAAARSGTTAGGSGNGDHLNNIQLGKLKLDDADRTEDGMDLDNLGYLSPFDEQEEWAKISEIMATFGTDLLQKNGTIKKSTNQQQSTGKSQQQDQWRRRPSAGADDSKSHDFEQLSNRMPTIQQWLNENQLEHLNEIQFIENGWDHLEFMNGILNENDLISMKFELADHRKILDAIGKLPKANPITNANGIELLNDPVLFTNGKRGYGTDHDADADDAADDVNAIDQNAYDPNPEQKNYNGSKLINGESSSSNSDKLNNGNVPVASASVVVGTNKLTIKEWLEKISLTEYGIVFERHLYMDMERVCRIWEIELQAVLEIEKLGHRKRILFTVSSDQQQNPHLQMMATGQIDDHQSQKNSDNINFVVPLDDTVINNDDDNAKTSTMTTTTTTINQNGGNGGELTQSQTQQQQQQQQQQQPQIPNKGRHRKNRPAPKPPIRSMTIGGIGSSSSSIPIPIPTLSSATTTTNSKINTNQTTTNNNNNNNNLVIRGPSELLLGVPIGLRAQWRHSASSLLSGSIKYEVNYMGSTVVKELRGTESTRKSIQKIKKGENFTASSSSSSPQPQPQPSFTAVHNSQSKFSTISEVAVTADETHTIFTGLSGKLKTSNELKTTKKRTSSTGSASSGSGSGSSSASSPAQKSSASMVLKNGSTTTRTTTTTTTATPNIVQISGIVKRPVCLSISYRGVQFIDIKTQGTICEHEIRNINCACQDADDLSHFAYITKDADLNKHFCHVFNVDSMDLATEIILSLGQAFEVAYQMVLFETAQQTQNRRKTLSSSISSSPLFRSTKELLFKTKSTKSTNSTNSTTTYSTSAAAASAAVATTASSIKSTSSSTTTTITTVDTITRISPTTGIPKTMKL